MVVGLAFTVMLALDISDATERAFTHSVRGNKCLIVIVDVTNLGAKRSEAQQGWRIQPLEEGAELSSKVFVIDGDVGVTGEVRCGIIGADLFQIVIAL